MWCRWQQTNIKLQNGFLLLSVIAINCLTRLPQCLAQGTKYGLHPPNKLCEENGNTVQWTGGQFEFPCASTKSLFKSSGKFLPKNVIATRAQIIRDSVFLALPRYRKGVPATLVKKTIKPETPIRKCPPKVVAISTKSGKIFRTIDLEGLTTTSSRLQYLAVDYAPDGACFVYVSDATNRAIIVFNIQADRGFRIVLPKAVTTCCRLRDVLYIALIRQDCGTTELYFTYLSTAKLFSLESQYLRTGVADKIMGKFLI